ncbi:MAG: large subunit ribosomal protein L4 [Myxococcota bacterium]|jgi:large subunit ribosomal protein L4
MPKVAVYNLDCKEVGDVTLDDTIFDVEVREHLFHEVVRGQLAARRDGTAKTKERNEIRGSMHKIWKQKGTGRARQGTKKAPHFVGGGVVHGPRPRSYAMKINKKVKAAALCAALSRRQQEGRLRVIDSMEFDAIKTKRVVSICGGFGAKKALFVDADNQNLLLSTRNLKTSHFLAVGQINVYDVLNHDTLLISKAAVEALHERMA